jgi:hypothetical protein
MLLQGKFNDGDTVIVDFDDKEKSLVFEQLADQSKIKKVDVKVPS